MISLIEESDFRRGFEVMPFHSLSKDGGVKSRASQAGPSEVFVALYKTGKSDDALTISIRFGGKVMEQLGWKRGDFVEIYEGDGDDAGMLQIEKTNDVGGRRLTDPSGLKGDPDAARLYILSKILVRHKLPSVQQTGQAVDFTASKGKLTLKLPSWAEPLSSPGKTTPAAAAPRKRRA
jgi:bifunctional DNA-binding transcriptional regulator/antitoxin component of YhaV-PrlF toxin-antitoxin module